MGQNRFWRFGKRSNTHHKKAFKNYQNTIVWSSGASKNDSECRELHKPWFKIDIGNKSMLMLFIRQLQGKSKTPKGSRSACFFAQHPWCPSVRPSSSVRPSFRPSSVRRRRPSVVVVRRRRRSRASAVCRESSSGVYHPMFVFERVAFFPEAREGRWKCNSLKNTRQAEGDID